MKLISDDILIDSGQQRPTQEAIYPTFEGFKFWDPAAWTNGHPFDLYRKMREDAPVMWSPAEKGMSGFWSVTRYDDIKEVELAHRFFPRKGAASTWRFPIEKTGGRKNWYPLRTTP